MAVASTGVRFDFYGRDVSAGRAADQVGGKFSGLASTAGTVGRAIATGIGVAAVGGVAALGAAMVQGVKDAQSYQTLALKTAAVIKSTGNVANVSVKGIQGLAAELESLSGVDEELIINSQNVLATFTKIRNETGKGNDMFDQATKAALNMSTALGTDLQGATIQVGKALNDPIKGITALQRVGVSFTQKQKDQVKAMVDSGRVMDAQKFILKELNTEFGGAAEAAGKGFAGSMARAKDAASDFARDMGARALPKLTEFADWFATSGVPKVRAFVGYIEKDLGPRVIAGVSNLKDDIEGALPKINWSGVGSGLRESASRWGGELIAGLKTGFEKGDWGPLGRSLGDGIGKALDSAVTGGAAVTKAIGKWFGSVDWFEVGSAVGKQTAPFAIGFLAKLGDNLITTAKEHPMDTAIALTSFLGVGKIAGAIGKILAKIPILRVFAPFFTKWNELTGPINGAIGGFFRLMGKGFREGFERFFPNQAARVLGKFDDLVLTVAVKALDAQKAGVKFVTGLVKGIGKGPGLVVGAVGKIIVRLLSPWVEAGLWLINRGRQFVGGLVRGIGSVGKTVTDAGGRTVTRLVTPFKNAGTALVARGRGYIDGLTRGIRERFGLLTGRINDAKGRITSGFSNAGTMLVSGGRRVIGGLLTGMREMMRGVGGWIKGNVVDPVVNAVKRHFGIRSPSRVMMGIGGHLITGLIKGMATKNPTSLVTKIFGSMPKALGALVNKGLLNLSSLPGKALDALGGLGGKFAGILDGIGGFLGGGGGNSAGLIAFGRWLQEMGYNVSEHPAFGGVAYGAHSKNSQHYRGQAIDVNRGAGTSAREQAYLAQIIGPAHRAGFKTIFMAPGHYNHAHIAMARGGVIGEPVSGYGHRTGKSYSFGENGPETVLPGAPRVGGGGGLTVIVQVNGPVAGSQLAVENMVVAAVDAAKRKGRIRV